MPSSLLYREAMWNLCRAQFPQPQNGFVITDCGKEQGGHRQWRGLECLSFFLLPFQQGDQA